MTTPVSLLRRSQDRILILVKKEVEGKKGKEKAKANKDKIIKKVVEKAAVQVQEEIELEGQKKKVKKIRNYLSLIFRERLIHDHI